MLTLVNNYLPGSDHLDVAALNVLSVLSILAGFVAFRLPWDRWTPRALNAIPLVGFVLLSLGDALGGVAPFSYGVYFVVVFVWVGLSLPPTTSLALAPFAITAYVLPGLMSANAPLGAVSSVTVAIPVSIIVAETIARTLRRLRQAELELRAGNEQALEAAYENRTAELNADRRRMAEAQAIARLGSWEWDVAADRLTWSDELYRIFGIDPEQFPATYEAYLDGVHPDDRPLVKRNVQKALSGQPYESDQRFVRPDGQVRWIHARGEAVTGPDGSVVLRGTCQDVTDAVEAKSERERSEERFRTILEAAQEGVWVCEGDGTTTFVNARMAAMLGYRPDEMVGRRIFEFMPASERASAAARLERRATAEQLERRFAHRDGTMVWGLVSVAPLPPAGGGGDGGVIAMVADISDRKRLEGELAHQARHDALTRLPNRLLLSDRIAAALARASAGDDLVAVLFVDVDRFKWINDSLGHETGDRVLQEVSRRLLDVVRPSDTVARLGGDEFVVLCEHVRNLDEAVALASRLIAAFEIPFEIDGASLGVAVSVGVAMGDGRDEPAKLIQDADSAMYQAKARGRGRAEVFDEANRRDIQTRFELAGGLRRALEEDEFVVHYQPIVNVASETVVGVEALVRWQHPVRGLMSPAAFIPLAEETGLIEPIGALVIDRACSQVARWNASRPHKPPLVVAVNLSAAQLSAPELVGTVQASLELSGLDPHLLHLEITESVLMADAEASAACLEALRALGVRLIVDDFGTGYSSLLYLRRFPVDILKIDASFVNGITSSAEDAAIVAAVIGLARSLNLRAVAEGVETSAQLEALRHLGCDLAQGYRWTPPLPAAELWRWLDDVAPTPLRPRPLTVGAAGFPDRARSAG